MNPAHLCLIIGPNRQPSSIELIDSPDALDVPARCEKCGDPSADQSGFCCYCQEKEKPEEL